MSDGLIIKDNPNIPSAAASRTEKPKPETSDYTVISSDLNRQVINELKSAKRSRKKSAMSFLTALSISGKNLISKKGRTIMTAIAGSFGIIGIALVLALSNGFTGYINTMQSESLAQFPLSVDEYWYDTDSLAQSRTSDIAYPDDHDIIIEQPASTLLHANNITDDYISYVKNMDQDLTSSVQFNYALLSNVLTKKTDGTIGTLDTSPSSSLLQSITSSSDYWNELPNNDDFVKSKYDVIEGTYPTSADQLVLIVDKYNMMSSSTLAALGFDASGKTVSVNNVLSKTFKIIPNNDYYQQVGTADVTGRFLLSEQELKDNNLLLSKFLEYISDAASEYSNGNTSAISDAITNINKFFETDSETRTLKSFAYPSSDATASHSLASLYDNQNIGETLKIVGILRPKDTSVTSFLSSGLYYRHELVEQQISDNANSDIAKSYQNNITMPSGSAMALPTVYNVINNNNAMTVSSNPLTNPSGYITESVSNVSKYIDQRKMLGTDVSVASITIYPKDFNSKAKILAYLDAYNVGKSDSDQIKYTDLAGTVFSSLEMLVNIISSILIAFAAISLVVSSVMIGIITYNSVIERTKEIGVLRAIGARKKDISRLFKAEASIIGLLSGTVGIGIAYLLCIPINLIMNSLNLGINLSNIASLNPRDALILIVVSVFLTYFSSLIPSRFAAKKDPVVALRTE